MHSKLALFEGMSPEQKGALIGSLLGAGVGGLGGAFGSKKDKLRNSILAALAGGAGGAGLGYLGGRYFAPTPIADATKKIAPEMSKAINNPAGYAVGKALPAAAGAIEAAGTAKFPMPHLVDVNNTLKEYYSKLKEVMNTQGQPALEEAPFKAVPDVAPNPESKPSGPLPYSLPAR